MDPILSAAMSGKSFGADWQGALDRASNRKGVTGRRGFFRRGIAAAASSLAMCVWSEAFAGNLNGLPSLYFGENARIRGYPATRKRTRGVPRAGAGARCAPSSFVC